MSEDLSRSSMFREQTLELPKAMTDSQRQLYKALRFKVVSKFLLHDLYLGAVRVLSDSSNPDRFSQAANSLRELLEKLLKPVYENVNHPEKIFPQLRDEIHKSLSDYKNSHGDKWKGNTIDRSLAKGLDKVEHYLYLNKQPKRADWITAAVEASYVGCDEIRGKTIEHAKKMAKRAGRNLQNFTHHNIHESGEQIAEKFKDCVAEAEEVIYIILENIALQQQAIHSIVNKQDRTEGDLDSLFEMVEANDANEDFFFEQITDTANADWLPILKERNYFHKPFEDDRRSERQAQNILSYMVKITSQQPSMVAGVIKNIPAIDHPIICNQIMEIARLLPLNLSVEIKTKVLEYVSISHGLWGDEADKLLNHWIEHNQIVVALDLLRELVRFEPDLQDKEKRLQRKSYNHQQSKAEHRVIHFVKSSLEPRHRMDSCFFRELMTGSVCSLIEKDPYGVAKVLIISVSHLIAIRFHDEEMDISGCNIWHKPPRARIYGSKDDPHEDSRRHTEVLVDTMTLACEKVYERQADKIDDLNKLLRVEKMEFFDKLRMRIQAKYLDDCKSHLHELEAKQKQEIVLVNKVEEPYYKPMNMDHVSFFDRSPFSLEELISLNDENLLNLVNTWNKEKKVNEDDFILSINRDGLAAMLYTVFRDKIVCNRDRMRFWLKNFDKIKYPAYIKEIIYATCELIEAERTSLSDDYFSFGKQAITRATSESNQRDYTFRRETSWSSIGWAVCKIIHAYLKKEVKPSPTTWDHLSAMLTMLCAQYDYDLDSKEHHKSTLRDPLNEAINTTRGSALTALFEFAITAKRYSVVDKLSVMKKIIEQRLLAQNCPSLTSEEYAVLGVYYPRVSSFDEEWFSLHRATFFPQENLEAWLASFGALIAYNAPSEIMFEVVRDNFDLVIQNLGKFREENRENTLLDILELRLFSFYMNGKHPMIGQNSLLDRYYQETAFDKQRRGKLLYTVGDDLRSNGDQFDKQSLDSVIAFFKHRVDRDDFVNMGDFNPWLDIKQLPLKDRLDCCLKVLETCQIESFSIGIWLKKFCTMLVEHPENTHEVIACFAKLTDRINSSKIVYIDQGCVKTIIDKGRKDKDGRVLINIARAVSNLIKKGLIRETNL